MVKTHDPTVINFVSIPVIMDEWTDGLAALKFHPCIADALQEPSYMHTTKFRMIQMSL